MCAYSSLASVNANQGMKSVCCLSRRESGVSWHLRDKKSTWYGPCSTICPTSFRLITFEIRWIARKDYHSCDHQDCANNYSYCFSSFSLSAALQSSKFQVVKSMIVSKSATSIVNKTTNTSRSFVPIEKNKIRSPAYSRNESFGHRCFYMCWMQNLKDSSVPVKKKGQFVS